MLQTLSIQNYALIDHLEIKFDPHLNVITGETGAGKSILLGALSLILGERADMFTLKDNQKKTIVEGCFLLQKEDKLNTLLIENDLSIEDNMLILRREILPQGKSRAFINDTPANLQLLKKITQYLVDLHQQFDTAALSSTDFQKQVVDIFGDNQAYLEAFKLLYQAWKTKNNQLEALKLALSKAEKEMDYNQFLLSELEELNLKLNEIEEIEKKLSFFSQQENIKKSLEQAAYLLKNNDHSILSQLKQMENEIGKYSKFLAPLPLLEQRLKSTYIEVDDIATEINSLNQNLTIDEQNIPYLNERFNQANKLLKKHQLQTTADLLILQDRLKNSLRDNIEQKTIIEDLEKETAYLYLQIEEKASALSARRQQAIPILEEKINILLLQVGMPNAKLKINLAKENIQPDGWDAIEFTFDANKSGHFESIKKIASGGELSRLMLSIKSLVANSIDLPTLIFDEIDTGISGEAAKQVGRILASIAIKRQIICITHQAQIAALGNTHFFVYKEENQDEEILTKIKKLSSAERIDCIAKILGGENPTAAILESAKEMLAQSFTE